MLFSDIHIFINGNFSFIEKVKSHGVKTSNLIVSSAHSKYVFYTYRDVNPFIAVTSLVVKLFNVLNITINIKYIF
jgi:hypothetical protein